MMTDCPWRPGAALSAAACADLAHLIAQVSLDVWPSLRPPVGARDGAQRDQRVHMYSCPVHATALQSRLDDQLVGAFDATATDRKALRLKGGVLDLVQPFAQIVQRSVARLASGCRITGSLNRQVGQRLQHLGGAMLVSRPFPRIEVTLERQRLLTSVAATLMATPGVRSKRRRAPHNTRAFQARACSGCGRSPSAPTRR